MTELHDRLAALSPAKRALLEKLRVAREADAIPRIADGPAPLSAEQRRLWYLAQLAPGYPIYTIPIGLRLHGPLEVEALLGALRDLVERHETLRTAFRESAGIPVQAVRDGAGFEPEVLDLRGEADWGEAEANYQTDAFARHTFDLRRGETFRALLLREADDEHRLLLGLHHLAGDGWSAAVLLRDLGELYAARVEGRESRLPALPVRYRDWAAWQQRPDRPPPAEDEAYWREQLAGAPKVLELPPDRPRPPVQGWEGAKHFFELAPPLAAAIRALAARERATAYAVLAAAFALLLKRYTGENGLLLGTLLANRPRAEVEHLAGFFANTLPLRLRMDGDPTAAEMVRRAHAAALGAQEHAGLPFDRIVEIGGARRDFSRPPLVQAVLTVTDSPASALALPGVTAEPLPQDASTAVFELTLQAEDRGDRYACAFQYSTELFEADTIARMARHLEAALAAFAVAPELRLSEVALARDDEVRAVEARQGSTRSAADGLAVHQLVEWQVRATPHAPALVHDGESVSYAELNADANRIAHALRRLGVEPETRVAVCLERTPALPAALLGVLKAGGAYVPLDPAHPAARHEAVLRLAGAGLVIASAASRIALPALPGVTVLDVAELDGGRDDDPEVAVTPANLAYVIFTSGSTGGPKGVEIQHRSAAAVLAWMRELLDDEERATVLGSTSVTFDVSVAEIFGTLAWGGTLLLVENALELATVAEPVGDAAMVPTAAAELLRDQRFPPEVSAVLLGGEPVPLGLVRELYTLPGVRRVLNLYGPTEDTTYSTCAELGPGVGRVTVGRPVTGGRVYVLDEGMRHAGVGVPGEVFTAGAGVARGYARRPALTAERFLPDPFGLPGARMYRTLDRGRWRDDGALEYLGRADAQVKVRGYRIELEEVEQALAAHPAVAEAGVAARGEVGAERHLAAFLVARAGVERPQAAELRAFLRERVPEYMVPGSFGWVEALPRTTSGKLDRRALPDHGDGPAEAAAPYVAPRSELEERLAALWGEVLEVERVGVHDDFFDLGGQSILATRLVARVREELGFELPVADLLTGPTVEQMARAVTGKKDPSRLPLVPLQVFGERPPLFVVHPAGGHVVCYRDLAYLLSAEQPVYALQPRGVEDGGQAPIPVIEEMATFYAEAVLGLRPSGPYRVAGWSFGGVVAWEMAQQLHAAGHEVDLLALFDTAPHTPEGMMVNAGDPAEIVWQTVAGLAGHAAASRVDVNELRGLEGREQALAMLRKMDLPRLFPESRVDDVLALVAVRAANLQAQAAYRPRPYPGHLTYFRTAGSDDAEGRSPGLDFWGALARGGVTAHRVAGSHGTILQDPFVRELARVILEMGAKKCAEC